ncbi:MAG TPA: hypothetical protein VGL77_04035 [Armatimonadota bacterium]|jgi:signal transduction histidine kinase
MDLTSSLVCGLLALFLADVALLGWLAVTVALHGERRSLMGWLIKSTMFFCIVLLVCDMQTIRSFSTDHPSYLAPIQAIFPGLIIPYVWYLATLQYGAPEQKRKWRSASFWLSAVVAGVLVVLLLGANVPRFVHLQPYALQWAIGPFSRAVLAIWPLFLVLCVGLSLQVLYGITAIPGSKVLGSMDDIRQVRRMLQLISQGILLSSLLLWAIFAWDPLTQGDGGKALLLGFAAITSGCVLLLGYLVIHFEIFSGHSLPRRDFRQYWRRAIALAVPLCTLMAMSVVVKTHKIQVLLLLVLSASTYFAVITSRSYAARQREFSSLRPFFRSRHLFDSLMRSSSHTGQLQEECADIFQHLCTDLLHTEVGYLIATGAFSPFVTAPLTQPRDATPDNIADVLPDCLPSGTPQCIPLPPHRPDHAKWAVPLWNEEQLIGVLLLGENRQNDIYTREEITLAAASSALLLDQLAGTRKARQLIDALRQKIADQQVMDLRPRRVLHDDIANHLILLLRQVNSAQTDNPAFKTLVQEQLQAILGEVGDLLAAMPKGLPSEIASLGLVAALRLMLDDYYADEFDEVVWQVGDDAEAAARALPPVVAEVAYHAAHEAIRNAAKYARGANLRHALRLTIALQWRNGLEVIIEDNGVGLRSYGEPSTGTRQGMAMHSAMMALYGGTLIPDSLPDQFTRISLFLPPSACRAVAQESVLAPE